MYNLTIMSEYRVWTLKRRVFNLIHRSNVYKPAIEYEDGSKSYQNFNEIYYVNKTDDFVETIAIGGWAVDSTVHSINNYPAVVYKNGTKEWYFYGVLHNLKGPAVIYPNGDVEYWRHGLRHRNYDPAVIHGKKQYWFVNGEFKKCTI